MSKKFRLIFIGIVFLLLPIFVSAASFNEKVEFFINSNYDINGRSKITALLKKIGSRNYFYIDEDWWNSLDFESKEEVRESLIFLTEEFENKIYPLLIETYGSEWRPGIDGDARITILIHPMRGEAGGYWNNGDEYPKAQNPKSNEKEMVYLNANYITGPLAESLLAHEFVHLITFNQKERKYGAGEEVWLNEARAEYAPTLLGFDEKYQGSNLQRRVKNFLEEPTNSLTEWQNTSGDYGVLNLFTQYLVEQYGIEILVDSLKSKEIGIKSLNKTLEQNGFDVNFSQIFTDWSVTVLANDCSLGEKYCYKNENLKNLRITPSINFLPLQGKSTLGVSQTTKNWSGNWFKFIGGRKGTLKIDFIGNPENLFRVPYLAKNVSGEYSLDFFQLDEYQRGEILVPEFGTEVSSVIIIPTIQSKVSGFLNPEPDFPFFWEASTIAVAEEEEEKPTSNLLEKPILEMSKQEVLAKISEIEDLVNQLKTRLTQLTAEEEMEPTTLSCQKFENNLYYGIVNNSEVKCLQEFLTVQGAEIYPEGLVTGNFLTLTKAAVIRFQEKYATDILTPLGLEEGTGFFGPKTRAKINQILGS